MDNKEMEMLDRGRRRKRLARRLRAGSFRENGSVESRDTDNIIIPAELAADTTAYNYEVEISGKEMEMLDRGRRRKRLARRLRAGSFRENGSVESRDTDNIIIPAELAADTTAYNYEVEISGDVQADNPLIATMLGLPTEVSFDARAAGKVTAVTEALEQAVDDENIAVYLPLISRILGLSHQDPLEDLENLIADSVAEIELDVKDTTGNSLIEIAPASDGELSITFTQEEAIAGILDGVDITAVGNTTLEEAAAALENLFEIELANGNGTVTAGTEITGFDFSFSNQTNSLEMNVADPDVLSNGIETRVNVTASGEFSVNLDLSEIDSSLDILGLGLPPALSGNIGLLGFLGIDELPLASGSFELQATREPVSVPAV